jgi:hypothetical protein
MKSVVAVLLSGCGIAAGLYCLWSESGVYEWWANLLMRADHSYPSAWVGLATMVTVATPFGLISGYLADERDTRRWLWRAGIALSLILIVGSITCVVAGKPVRVIGEPSVIFRAASLLPQEFILEPHRLPRLERNYIAGVAGTRSSGTKERTEPTLYIPFDPNSWPDATTPVIFKTTASRFAQISKLPSATFTYSKRPVPLLVRQRWGANTLRYAVVVSANTSILEVWLFVWVISGLFLLGTLKMAVLGPARR